MAADGSRAPSAADHRRIATDPGRLDLIGAPEGFDALVMADIVRARGGLSVFVARDGSRLSAFIDAFKFFAQGIEVLQFPSWDCLPYDRTGPSPGVAAQRMTTLARLAEGLDAKKPSLLVTTTPALMQRVPPKAVVQAAAYSARTGNVVEIADLERYFAVNGYARASTVSERGEFAIRGGVIDVFPPNADEPVRLDLFGDTLESIRGFDPDTQRSTRQLKEISLHPVSEALLDKDSISRFRRGYVEAFGAPGGDPLYETVSGGGRRAGMEHWLPLFYPDMATLFDYLPDSALIGVDHLAGQARDERLAMIADAYDARAQADRKVHYHPLAPDALYLTAEEWRARLAERATRQFSAFQEAEGELVVDMGARQGRTFVAERQQDSVNLFQATADHARNLAAAGKRVLFASWSEGSSERLGVMLADHGLTHVTQAPYWDAAKAANPKLPQRVVLPLESGFETDTLAVISETDILGDRLARPRRKRRASNFLAEASSLSPGDLVVHIDHGIGRYEGLKTLEVQGAPHDCLELQYGAEAKLYLPVENIDLLTRYGSEGDGVQLDRLGGAAWQARKAKAKERLRDMAIGLIQIAAARATRHTDPVDPPHGVFDEFCARFPYEETEDQLSAIHDILEDLSAGKPMDRLICGDVGFGKTEVALRAAFVVAMSGQQVAIVAPTTLLARQHYKTFTERFQGWPIKVTRLSRLVPPKEAAETREALKNGEVEIIVGTHAVLSKQVGFKNLGLVIVDEEQHFGVKHKEKLKELRADVHMLTLTATPIPRTLQMSLSGIREMSIIATPPVDRLAVRTYVTPFDSIVIREALLREKYRGGQAYYVVPRISDLTELERFLREQVPEVRYVVGHGQMAPTQLEDVMSAFYEGQYDVLLSTTIVESGLDIPTANTLIIHRADMFGLAQLYQLRGRVGRAKARAYAYMTTPPEKQITISAERRLKVLQSLDSLGAGFQLASHDLDQRGGGNLLGEEQSGHIREIGVELYQQMLEDAVNDLKELAGKGEGATDRGWSPQINTGAAVLIPEDYVPDLHVRLSLYRRLSDAEKSGDREALAAEMIDRFGPLPPEAGQLLKVVAIKGLCREANVAKIDVGPKGAVVTFRGDDFPNPMGLMQFVTKNQVAWKVRPDNKVVVRGEWETPEQRLNAAERVLSELAKLAGAAVAA
ncbi:transcription-repair coupling factor [Phenylobacterium sp. 20VBR1]|uniref:Transcription-repair-coupling factor n=1 Tax=Phenylobacterium glaciei TaxID=2803784 RepID=A0A941D165_9CAUL|nr:transcription-repair coupling factor [Phenylobacterium glaciei]MBR7620037.1 transcription-repair coupling factor [Phenylobacterium glaciei]